MKPPEQDLTDRLPIWDELQMLYMDTDVTTSYDRIVAVCLKSKYSVGEIEEILFNEVLPAVRFNMWMLPAPEWCGFETEWLKRRVLKKHRFGKRRPLFLRLYTRSHWKRIRDRMVLQSSGGGLERSATVSVVRVDGGGTGHQERGPRARP